MVSLPVVSNGGERHAASATECGMFAANDPNPTEPDFLIVTDFDAGLFSVEGPMTVHGT